MVERCAENVAWQFFSDMAYCAPRLPCDATQIGRFRQLLGEDGIEQLLKATIDCAVAIKAVKPADLERLIVNSMVQSKAIAQPVHSRLLEIARHKVVSTIKRYGIALKQTYSQESKTLRRKAGGCAHARQFKRLRTTVKCQRTILGVVMREVQRKLDAILCRRRFEGTLAARFAMCQSTKISLRRRLRKKRGACGTNRRACLAQAVKRRAVAQKAQPTPGLRALQLPWLRHRRKQLPSRKMPRPCPARP